VDAQLIESYKLTVADVARVFRVPLAIVGELGGATLNNTETLIRHWLSTGLGFMLEHIELAFDVLFELPEDEFVAFDVEYLLRADFAARMDGLVKAVQGGVYSPNEARRKEGLPAVAHGEEPRVQAQVVPLSAATLAPAAPAAPATPAAPTPSEGKTADHYLAVLRSMKNAA
jgi:phage portal protein BeeE